jgi:1-acyl-sn-glycerol-3-phosphate acyltransferase
MMRIVIHAVPESASMALRGDHYHWRWFGTALSYAAFGVCGLLIGITCLPLLAIAPIGERRRRRLGRRMVQGCFRTFVAFMAGLGAMTYEVRGAQRLGRPGQLLLANHPSLIDVVFLIAFTPAAGCVVKAALWRNPFTAGVVRAAGYVRNSPTDEMIHGAAAALEDGQSVIMFPEGTRSTPGQPLAFHRGAAAVALRAARVLTPIVIRVVPLTLTKHEPWYRIPARRPHFSLEVGEDLPLAKFRDGSPAPQASRALNSELLAHFQRLLSAPAGVGKTAPPV